MRMSRLLLESVATSVAPSLPYSNHPALREHNIKRSGLSKVPEGPKRMAGRCETTHFCAKSAKRPDPGYSLEYEIYIWDIKC